MTCPEGTELDRREAEAEERAEAPVEDPAGVEWEALRPDRREPVSAPGVARRWLTKQGYPATR